MRRVLILTAGLLLIAAMVFAGGGTEKGAAAPKG
jgi:hypothetical protein